MEKEIIQIGAIAADETKFHVRGPESVKRFLQWLETHTAAHSTVVVYFHNLQYDLGDLFADRLDDLDVTLVASRLIKALHGAAIVYRDTINLFPMRLTKLGEAFDLPKLPKNVHSKAYVMRDCRIMELALRRIIQIADEFDVSLPSTLGGFCVNIWGAMGGGNWQCAEPFARSALYGGRVELFCQGGEGHIVYCDLNSLYPSVMTRRFPGVSKWQPDLCEYGVAEVTMRVPDMAVAPLPYRLEDGRIFYPVGRVRGRWTCHEIRAAMDSGAKLLTLHDCYGSAEGEFYYADFVLEFYRRRLAVKSEPEKLLYKLLMNNLYGQLAMTGEITRSLNLTEKDYPVVQGGPAYGRKKLFDTEIPLPEHVNWLHGSYITSYGRIELGRYLRSIPPENLIYCDTDSMFFFWNPAKPLPFETGDELGQMKVVDTATSARVRAPKLYRFGDETKAKGVPRKHQEDYFDFGRADFFSPFRLREAINYFDDGNSRPLSVWRKVHKIQHGDYDKKDFRGGRYHPKRVDRS